MKPGVHFYLGSFMCNLETIKVPIMTHRTIISHRAFSITFLPQTVLFQLPILGSFSQLVAYCPLCKALRFPMDSCAVCKSRLVMEAPYMNALY